MKFIIYILFYVNTDDNTNSDIFKILLKYNK